MDHFGFVLGILFLVVVVPMWIRHHYRHRTETRRALNAEDERVLADLRALAERMENRVQTLERILDAESPGWRNKLS